MQASGEKRKRSEVEEVPEKRSSLSDDDLVQQAGEKAVLEVVGATAREKRRKVDDADAERDQEEEKTHSQSSKLLAAITKRIDQVPSWLRAGYPSLSQPALHVLYATLLLAQHLYATGKPSEAAALLEPHPPLRSALEGRGRNSHSAQEEPDGDEGEEEEEGMAAPGEQEKAPQESEADLLASLSFRPPFDAEVIADPQMATRPAARPAPAATTEEEGRAFRLTTSVLSVARSALQQAQFAEQALIEAEAEKNKLPENAAVQTLLHRAADAAAKAAASCILAVGPSNAATAVSAGASKAAFHFPPGTLLSHRTGALIVPHSALIADKGRAWVIPSGSVWTPAGIVVLANPETLTTAARNKILQRTFAKRAEAIASDFASLTTAAADKFAAPAATAKPRGKRTMPPAVAVVDDRFGPPAFSSSLEAPPLAAATSLAAPPSPSPSPSSSAVFVQDNMASLSLKSDSTASLPSDPTDFSLPRLPRPGHSNAKQQQHHHNKPSFEDEPADPPLSSAAASSLSASPSRSDAKKQDASLDTSGEQEPTRTAVGRRSSPSSRSHSLRIASNQSLRSLLSSNSNSKTSGLQTGKNKKTSSSSAKSAAVDRLVSSLSFEDSWLLATLPAHVQSHVLWKLHEQQKIEGTVAAVKSKQEQIRTEKIQERVITRKRTSMAATAMDVDFNTASASGLTSHSDGPGDPADPSSAGGTVDLAGQGEAEKNKKDKRTPFWWGVPGARGKLLLTAYGFSTLAYRWSHQQPWHPTLGYASPFPSSSPSSAEIFSSAGGANSGYCLVQGKASSGARFSSKASSSLPSPRLRHILGSLYGVDVYGGLPLGHPLFDPALPASPRNGLLSVQDESLIQEAVRASASRAEALLPTVAVPLRTKPAIMVRPPPPKPHAKKAAAAAARWASVSTAATAAAAGNNDANQYAKHYARKPSYRRAAAETAAGASSFTSCPADESLDAAGGKASAAARGATDVDSSGSRILSSGQQPLQQFLRQFTGIEGSGVAQRNNGKNGDRADGGDEYRMSEDDEGSEDHVDEDREIDSSDGQFGKGDDEEQEEESEEEDDGGAEGGAENEDVDEDEDVVRGGNSVHHHFAGGNDILNVFSGAAGGDGDDDHDDDDSELAEDEDDEESDGEAASEEQADEDGSELGKGKATEATSQQ